MVRAFKVLRKDIQDSRRTICSMAAIFIGFYFLLWVLYTFVFGSSCSVDERKDYFWILVAVFSALTPGTTYGYVNEERGETAYLLLPASLAGKITVMVILSVFLYPAGYLLIQGTVDSLLAAVGGYSGSIWPEVTGAGQRYLHIILLSSMFMSGNIQFKSGKTGKSAIMAFTVFLLWGLVKRHISDTDSVDTIQQILLYVAPPLLWMASYSKIKFR